jgi:hypothetical protein
MNILTLICFIILSLVSVLALVTSMLGGFFLGTILALFSLIGCVYATDSIIRFL